MAGTLEDMADPLAFRDSYRTAALVKATKTADNGLASTWTVDVYDGASVKLGSTSASFIGSFPYNGVAAVGPKLLDLEVLASSWVYSSGDGSWSSSARSQRA